MQERSPQIASVAPLSLDASVSTMVADLEGQDLAGLHRQWRNRLGGQAPAHLPRWLLLRLLAYRLQTLAFGDLDKSVRRVLRGDGDETTARFDKRAPQTRQGICLKPGALVVREWRGKLERVMVLEEGFAWNGKPYGSLSQIAKAMTGTNWNGHRFFGLREGKEQSKSQERLRQKGGVKATGEVERLSNLMDAS
jgi:Protein of unknown function (DUF2924)